MSAVRMTRLWTPQWRNKKSSNGNNHIEYRGHANMSNTCTLCSGLWSCRENTLKLLSRHLLSSERNHSVSYPRVHGKLPHHSWAEEDAEPQRPDFTPSGSSPLLCQRQKADLSSLQFEQHCTFSASPSSIMGEIKHSFSSIPGTSSADAQRIGVCT